MKVFIHDIGVFHGFSRFRFSYYNKIGMHCRIIHQDTLSVNTKMHTSADVCIAMTLRTAWRGHPRGEISLYFPEGVRSPLRHAWGNPLFGPAQNKADGSPLHPSALLLPA